MLKMLYLSYAGLAIAILVPLVNLVVLSPLDDVAECNRLVGSQRNECVIGLLERQQARAKAAGSLLR